MKTKRMLALLLALCVFVQLWGCASPESAGSAPSTAEELPNEVSESVLTPEPEEPSDALAAEPSPETAEPSPETAESAAEPEESTPIFPVVATPTPTPEPKEPAAEEFSMYDLTEDGQPMYVSWVKNSVYLRSTPSMEDDSNIICTIPAGSMVTGYYKAEAPAGWDNVGWNGQQGYVRERYITLTQYGGCEDADVYFDYPVSVDLDRDGVDEVLSRDTESQAILITDNGKTDVFCEMILSPGPALVADATGDGYPEVYILDYGPSDDYNVTCVTYTPYLAGYRNILFEETPGIRTNSGDGPSFGAIVTGVSDNILHVAATTDIFQTISATWDYYYDPVLDQFRPVEPCIWQLNRKNIMETACELPAEIDGQEIMLPAGSQMRFTQAYFPQQGYAEITFMLRDGTLGVLHAEPDPEFGFPYWIDGKTDGECFVICYYAD